MEIFYNCNKKNLPYMNNNINNILREIRAKEINLDPAVSQNLFAWSNMETMGLVNVDKKTGEEKGGKKEDVRKKDNRKKGGGEENHHAGDEHEFGKDVPEDEPGTGTACPNWQIPGAAIDELEQLVKQATSSRELLLTWFGKAMTEPRHEQ